MITRLRLVLPTLRRLGFGAVASVAAYRLACRFGLYRHWLPVRQWQGGGDFFAPTVLPAPVISPASRATILARADKVQAGELVYFSSIGKKIGNPPDWFQDPFSGGRLAQEDHWSALDEFSTGDIKNVWEASRFEWVPLLARAWRLTGDDRYPAILNGWLLDWLRCWMRQRY